MIKLQYFLTFFFIYSKIKYNKSGVNPFLPFVGGYGGGSYGSGGGYGGKGRLTIFRLRDF